MEWSGGRAVTGEKKQGRGAGKSLLAAGAAVLILLLAGVMGTPLCAQTYPSRPVRLILPFPPGGATDVLGRIVAQKFSEGLGQSFVSENRPGAGGNIGLEVTAQARPDGYTIAFSSASLTISPGLYKKLNYDTVKDLAPIAKVLEGHYVLLVRPSLPVNTLLELVEYAKARPGKLNFGSGGVGTANHLSCELFKSLAKLNIVHVPYKGVNQAMVAMMGNEVDMVVIGTPAALPQIRAGKVRPLAVLSDRRVPTLPQVPTSREAGMEKLNVTPWYGLVAPAGTPKDIITRLNAEWQRVAALPDTKEKLDKVEFDPLTGTPEQFAEFIKSDIARWTAVVREAKLSVD